MHLKNIPFHIIAGVGYVIGNGTLTLKGFLFEDKTLIPIFSELKNLDPSSWQACAGFFWLVISFLTFTISKSPILMIRLIAFLNYLAYFCMIISAYKQDAFWAQTIGILPWFFVAGLLFQGNKVVQEGSIVKKYPIAIAGVIFALGNIGISYNGWASEDYVLFALGILFIFANLSFAITDKNLQRKLFA